MKKFKSIIALQLLILILIVSLPGMMSSAVTELSVKPNTTESDVHADILLPDATVGVKYKQEATVAQVITGFVDPSDKDYAFYMMMANSATITKITLVKGTVPDGLAISNTSKAAKFEGTPTKSGNYTFYVDIVAQVAMLGQVQSKTLRAKVSITVLPEPPSAPTFTSKPNSSYEVEQGKSLNISVSISCPQTCNLVLYIKQGGSYNNISSKNSATSWSFDPLSLSGKSSVAGTYEYKIEAVNTKDSSVKSSCTFTVEVTEKPVAPTNAVISGNSTCNAGDILTFSCTANGKNLTYKWYIKKGGASSFSALATGSSCSFETSTYDDSAQIKCVVSNSAGETTSNVIVIQVAQPHEHSFTKREVVKKASCISAGIERLICECGSYQVVSSPTIDHSYESEWTIEKNADCVNDGVKYHKCSVCGDKTDITVIQASGHVFGDWVETVAPTYEKEGTKQRNCKKCSHFETQAIPKLIQSHTHSFTKWVTVKEPTCTQTGLQTSTCSCKESITQTIPAKGHSFSAEYKITTQPTCTESGIKAYVCSACNITSSETKIDPKGHSFGEWKVINEPTAQAEGISERSCSECDYKETKTIAKLISGHEHSFGEWFESIPASCTSNGEEKHVCSCGLSETRSTSPTGHSFGTWTVDTAQSCESAGKEKRVCHCGEMQQREIPAKGHSYGAWTVFIEPAQGEKGVAERVCSSCGKKDYKEIIGAEDIPTPVPTVDPTAQPTAKPTPQVPITPSANPTGSTTNQPGKTEIDPTAVPKTDPGKQVSIGTVIIIVAVVVLVMLAAGCIAIKIVKSGINK